MGALRKRLEGERTLPDWEADRLTGCVTQSPPIVRNAPRFRANSERSFCRLPPAHTFQADMKGIDVASRKLVVGPGGVGNCCGHAVPPAHPWRVCKVEVGWLVDGLRRNNETGRSNGCHLFSYEGMKSRSCGLVQRIGTADSATPHPDPSGGQAPALHSPLPAPLDSGESRNHHGLAKAA